MGATDCRDLDNHNADNRPSITSASPAFLEIITRQLSYYGCGILIYLISVRLLLFIVYFCTVEMIQKTKIVPEISDDTLFGKRI